MQEHIEQVIPTSLQDFISFYFLLGHLYELPIIHTTPLIWWVYLEMPTRLIWVRILLG